MKHGTIFAEPRWMASKKADPAQYRVRHTVARGRDGFPQGLRVATRLNQYAQRCLNFLYWAGTWIGMKSNLNVAWLWFALKDPRALEILSTWMVESTT